MLIASYTRNIRISVPVGDEQVVLVCRKPAASEVSQFLNSRFQSKGRKVESHLVEARIAFVDKILVNVENASYETAGGEMQPLTAETVLAEEDKTLASGVLGFPVRSWKDLVNPTWKVSAAMFFEEAQPEGEEKN